MKLAYSTLGCPGWTVEQAAEAVKRYGYDAIEWRLADGEVITSKTPQAVIDRLVEATRKEDLTVACLDTSCKFVQATEEARRNEVQEAKFMLDLAAELGAPFIRVFGGFVPEGMTREDVLGPSGQALAEAAAYGKSKGVTVLLETHDDWCASPNAMRLAEAGGPNVQILWDSHHPFRMGESPTETLQLLKDGEVVKHVHIKDARRDPTEDIGWHLTLLEEGEVPIKEMVGRLASAGYDGYLSVEWEKKWHPDIEEPEEAFPQHAMLLRSYIAEAEASQN